MLLAIVSLKCKGSSLSSDAHAQYEDHVTTRDSPLLLTMRGLVSAETIAGEDSIFVSIPPYLNRPKPRESEDFREERERERESSPCV
jgi:hypothetical protein